MKEVMTPRIRLGKPVKGKVSSSLRITVYDSVYSSVYSSVNWLLRDSVCDAVCDSLWYPTTFNNEYKD